MLTKKTFFVTFGKQINFDPSRLFQHLSILEAIRSKAVLSKFCESVLSKSAKIHGLVNDLQKNYEDEMAVKSNTQFRGC